MADALSPVLALAQSQHGLFTRRQALELGVHPSVIDRAVAAGRISVVLRGTYRLNGTPITWEQRALAACLTAGPDAAVSHRAAAHLWGLDGFGPPGRIELVAPRHLRHTRHGAVVHETLDWHLVDVRLRRGIPVTGPARTLLDVCWVGGELSALGCFDEIQRLRLATWDEMWRCLVLHARRGRPGVRRMRRILIRRWGKRSPVGVFARLVLDLLVDAGLPEPVAEHPVVVDGHRHRIDLAYPRLLIGIECDGAMSHDTDRALEEDPVRQKRLEDAGWLVIRIRWERLVADPASIVREVRAAITARSCVR